jgi:hypothetical protein
VLMIRIAFYVCAVGRLGSKLPGSRMLNEATFVRFTGINALIGRLGVRFARNRNLDGTGPRRTTSWVVLSSASSLLNS